jgi:hypothetical protein
MGEGRKKKTLYSVNMMKEEKERKRRSLKKEDWEK